LCCRCGTQLTFEHADFPDEIDVTTSSLDNPELIALRDNTRARLDSGGSPPTDSRNIRKLDSRGKIVDAEITLRPLAEHDVAQVRELFITVNRLLSPADLRDAFEAYLERALTEEIDHLPAYYGERDGGFWVAVKGDKVVGTFGLERASNNAMELRRMYVHPSARRQGIARQMLNLAEDECRRRSVKRLELTTAAIQHAAIALYENAGYRLVRQETAEKMSNKTVGSSLRRYYFEKAL
jgi:putative acetyltransferase